MAIVDVINGMSEPLVKTHTNVLHGHESFFLLSQTLDYSA